MSWGTNAKGYTIVEVLIFVAVSGFMFVIAAAAISGKQANAEFRQGVNATNERIRSVINDVNNGKYPDPASAGYTCIADDAGGSPHINAGSSGQGTNRTCTFIGKVVQFNVDGQDTRYAIYTVVGRQYLGRKSDAKEVASFSEAQPTVVTLPGTIENKTTDWSIQVNRTTSGGSQVSGIGFYKSFGVYDNGGNAGLRSGAQGIWVVPVSGTVGANAGTAAAEIGTGLLTASPVNNPDIVVCATDGGNRFAAIRIGGANGQRISTSVTYGTDVGVCA